MRFFDEYFGFHRARTVFKDNDRRRKEKIPQWNTAMLIHDARMLIQHLLREDENVIAELLTTNKYFIAHPGDNQYAREHYEARVAEVMDPGFIDAQVEKRQDQIKRDFNFKDMPEKAARALESARKDAVKTVTKYKTAMDKGMYPFRVILLAGSHGVSATSFTSSPTTCPAATGLPSRSGTGHWSNR